MEAMVDGALKRRYGMIQEFLSWLGFGILMKRWWKLRHIHFRPCWICNPKKFGCRFKQGHCIISGFYFDTDDVKRKVFLGNSRDQTS